MIANSKKPDFFQSKLCLDMHSVHVAQSRPTMELSKDSHGWECMGIVTMDFVVDSIGSKRNHHNVDAFTLYVSLHVQQVYFQRAQTAWYGVYT